MKSVLGNFLGTYTSRNADLGGYWAHGQLPSELVVCTLDLLRPPPAPDPQLDAPRRLAMCLFAEQVKKAGLALGDVRAATLRIKRDPEVRLGWRGGVRAEGHMVGFVARAAMHSGRTYEREKTVFVAPHDPTKEHRRGDPWP